jgi:Spy/CpxP family protein refolding chaperone
MKGISLLVALLVAAPLAAQQPDSAKKAMPMRGHPGMMGQGMGQGMMQGQMQGMMGPMMGHMQMMGGMMGPMMRGMAFDPGRLLMHKEVLQLTDQQVSKLTALRDAARTAHDAAMKDMHTHMQEMLPLLQGASPDTAKIKPHFQAVQAAMANAHWAMLVASTQARAVLTDVQRARVEGWADAMQHRGMMGGMMGGMMMHRPERDSMPGPRR